jgi:hypothetical protein
MKRLFILRNGKRGAPIRDSRNEVLAFASKPEAKAARDALGGDHVVSFGPDHSKFKGQL